MFKISVPLSVPVTKKKKFYLNLNQYRNAHHFTLSKAKTNYHDVVAPRLKHLPSFTRIHLVYHLFTGTEQLCDTSNICSIVDKFFSDILVSCKKITDDNRKIVLSATYRWGGVDKHDPRVEVTIIPDEDCQGEPATQFINEESNMQITINQAEIEEAIRNHILARITVRDDMRIDIDLRATRGDEGYTAVIDIVPNGTERKVAEPAAATATAIAEAKLDTKAAAAKAPSTSVFKKAAANKTIQPKEPEPVNKQAAEPEVAATQDVEPDMSAEADQASQPDIDMTETDETAQEAPAAAPTRPSLFAGLKKPENA